MTSPSNKNDANFPDLDKMTPEEMMAWLEELAHRQGATETFSKVSDVPPSEILEASSENANHITSAVAKPLMLPAKNSELLSEAELKVVADPLTWLESLAMMTDRPPLSRLRATKDYLRLRQTAPLTLVLGKPLAGEGIFVDLTSLPHLFISGALRSDRLTFLQTLIACLLLQNHPTKLSMLFLDAQSEELLVYRGIPHLVADEIGDLPIHKLEWLRGEITKRHQQFNAVGVNTFQDYIVSRGKLAYLLVVIEDLDTLLKTLSSENELPFTELVNAAATVGIHFLVSSAYITSQVVHFLDKGNFRARAAFKANSEDESNAVLGVSAAYQLREGIGDVLYQSPASSALIHLQSASISAMEIDNLIQFWTRQNTSAPALTDVTLWVASSHAPAPSEEEEIQPASLAIQLLQAKQAGWSIIVEIPELEEIEDNDLLEAYYDPVLLPDGRSGKDIRQYKLTIAIPLEEVDHIKTADWEESTIDSHPEKPSRPGVSSSASSSGLYGSSGQAQTTSTTDNETLLFTAYYPEQVEAEVTYNLLLYVHLPTYQSEIEQDVKAYEHLLGDSIPIPQLATRVIKNLAIGAPIRVEIDCENPDFTPVSQPEQEWNNQWRRFEFSFKPSAQLIGKTIEGRILILVSQFEVARLEFSIAVGEPRNELARAKLSSRTARMYQRIFVSYSRKDSEVVEWYRLAQMTVGHEVFKDTYSLLPGEDWRSGLANGIDNADIFQLFWSKHSADSENVRNEWEYALKYRCPQQDCAHFIRPVFWEKPMPEPPKALSRLNFRFVDLGIKPSIEMTSRPLRRFSQVQMLNSERIQPPTHLGQQFLASRVFYLLLFLGVGVFSLLDSFTGVVLGLLAAVIVWLDYLNHQ